MTPPVLAASICALAYLGLVTRPPDALRSALKTAAVALLAAAALTSAAPALLTIALALCALGDYCLSRDGDRAFMAGIAAFAAGHLAYVALFLTHPASAPDRLTTPGGLALATGLSLLGLAMARHLAPHAGALKYPVLVYVPVILAMGLSAFTLPPDGALGLALPAALAFIASDLVLAAETFLLPAAHPAHRWTPYAIWPLYWGAQAGFLAAFT